MSSEPPMVLTQDFDQLEAQADFRHACSRFATGIALLSLLDADGQPHGMTVNSFTSVSLDPLLFLVCIDYKAGIWPSAEDRLRHRGQHPRRGPAAALGPVRAPGL